MPAGVVRRAWRHSRVVQGGQRRRRRAPIAQDLVDVDPFVSEKGGRGPGCLRAGTSCFDLAAGLCLRQFVPFSCGVWRPWPIRQPWRASTRRRDPFCSQRDGLSLRRPPRHRHSIGANAENALTSKRVTVGGARPDTACRTTCDICDISRRTRGRGGLRSHAFSRRLSSQPVSEPTGSTVTPVRAIAFPRPARRLRPVRADRRH